MRAGRFRAVSPLLATVILIGIVLVAGLAVYTLTSGMLGSLGKIHAFQVVSADMIGLYTRAKPFSQ